jgi:hypothetical protein
MRVPLFPISLATGRLAVFAAPRGGEWLADEVKSLRAQGVDCVASLLTPLELRELDLLDEQDRCRDGGIVFAHCAINDRGVPVGCGTLCQGGRRTSCARTSG